MKTRCILIKRQTHEPPERRMKNNALEIAMSI